MNAPHRYQPGEDALRRIEDLEEEVAYLRGLLQVDAPLAERLQRTLSLAPQGAALLALLYHAKGLRSREALDAGLPRIQDRSHDRQLKTVDVHASKIRACLPAGSLETVWGQGFALTKVGRRYIEAILAGERPPSQEPPAGAP